MTDKVQKIKTKIERLLNEPAPSHDSQCNWEDGYWCALYKIEEFIDSLQKEPISDDLEEAAYHNCIDRLSKESIEDFKAGANWQKEKDESTTEDLEEYINELSKQFPEVLFAKLSRIAVRVTKWQQERDEADRAEVYKCGWNDMKAMMMKKSFDAKIFPTNIEETEFCLDDYEEVAIITERVNKGEFKMGDKVKVYVVKLED